MIKIPVKKIAGLIGTILIISSCMALISLYFSTRGELPRYATISFATLGAGAILIAITSFNALREIKRGLLQSLEEIKNHLGKNNHYLHTTEKMATVGRLAAGVAHEIRNPLTSIKMRLFSLSRELQEESSQKEDLDVIKEEVDRLEEIVNNFLRFARPPEVKLAPASAEEILTSVLDLLKHRFESQDIKISLEKNINDTSVMVDRQQIRQVFMNVLLNACDALPDGGIIKISYLKTENNPGEKMVKIVIGNSGPAIPPEDASNIFEPFFSTRDEGTGLGLSIARQIVEQHGGKLILDEPEEGLPVRFSIFLPAVKEFNKKEKEA